MLNRKIDNKISRHYSDSRKALFLSGARQVGKTYAIRKYAEQNGLNLVELNFFLQPETKSIIAGAKDVSDLLLRISAYTRVPMVPGKTLVFFDEIQECSDVMTWVKALVDDGSYLYALSGSLLGVEMKNIRSVPVGYMSEYQMFPLDFEEFAQSLGIPDNVISALHCAWMEKKPVDEYVHRKMLQIFNLYLIVGGMPAAVQAYVDTNNIQNVVKEQRDILNLYKLDIARYDSDSRKKLYINEVFDLIPSELNNKNKRFILKRLNEHMTFGRHEEDFIWLKDADMALPVYNVEEPVIPLKLNEQRNLFKLFQNDVGLLSCQYSSAGIQLSILQGEVNVNYGSVFENAVAQELHAHGWPLYYFNSKKQGELDFLLESDNEVIPVEVKSGKNYERHNALSNVLSTPNYAVPKAYVFCNDNLHTDGSVEYLPIYMVMFIQKPDDRADFVYKIDLSGF
ncbi:MAG: ATP-binding protein [Candidatus Cryptobacteroides sp.]